MKRKTIDFNNQKYYLGIDRYDNNKLCLFICDIDEDYISDITINLKNLKLPNDDLVVIQDLCRNSGFELKLIEEKIIKEIDHTIEYELQEYDVARINIKELRKYDPEGYKEFIESHNYEEEQELEE